MATRWIPEYLDFDEFRALAVKAIWALGAIPGPEARDAPDSGAWAREFVVSPLGRTRGVTEIRAKGVTR
ncbi:hypothetical protein [Streptomyces albidochromogenes]|uniref:Uncharacterized protein n=1 Tax=Streptomyces albidochromogenes TaxID=329524 RepID=A0ABW6FVP8_9ACTN